MAISPYVSEYFRNVRVPKETLKTQKDIYKWVISTFRDDEPIANHELVFAFRMTRHGGILHNLRQEGWVIDTIGTGQNVSYKLVAKPDETDLKLFHNE